MSFQKKIDDMVGVHVAEFQLKYTVAKELESHRYRPPMPYGYPMPVYRPLHTCRIPRLKPFTTHHHHGALTNGVPRVLTMDIVADYPLGVWVPPPAGPTEKT